MEENQIKSVSDMMRALQQEIEAVKDGTLAESTANVVFKGRKLQLQNAALNLQFLRMFKGGQAPAGEMLLLQPVDGNGEATPKPSEPVAEKPKAKGKKVAA